MNKEEEYNTDEIVALFKVWLQVLISLTYSYFVVSKLPQGKFRFFSLVPVFYLFTLIPLSLSSPTTTGLSGVFVTWLANFKLLLFSFGLGPLSQDLPAKSFFEFLLVTAFPIKIKRNENDPFTPEPMKGSFSFWVKFLIYVGVNGVMFKYNEYVHPNILMGIYCILTYVNLELIMGFYVKILGLLIGVELAQPFNKPYLSTSLQDFWGRRWNLMVSDMLRQTVYFPVREYWEYRFSKEGLWARRVGIMAAFVVSGLMHELLYYYITRVAPTWEVTCFFVLQGVCMVVEMDVKRAFDLGDGWWPLTGPLTLGFVVYSGFWLFFPQLVRNQLDVRSVAEFKAVIQFLKRLFGWNFSRFFTLLSK